MSLRADLHVHTRFSEFKHLRAIGARDSYNHPEAVFDACLARGMDLVAITDHDTIDGALDLLAKRPELEPLLIVGEEVEARFPDTGQWVHVNVFDVSERDHAELRRLRGDVHDIVAWLKVENKVHVLNHPFQSYRLQKPAARYLDDIVQLFDCFEVGNGTLPARHDRAVEELIEHAAAMYLTRHGVGGSDAHDLDGVAGMWTEVDVAADASDAKTAFLDALRRGEGRAAGRRIGAVQLAANVCAIVGRYYLSLRDPEMRRSMRLRGWLGAALLAPASISGLPAALALGNTLRVEAVVAHVRAELLRQKRASEIDLSAVPGESEG